MKSDWPQIQNLKSGLIVSCQASEGEPLCRPEHILALALSAINGGARALRLEGVDNVEYVRKCPDVPANMPVVGLVKSTTVADFDRLDKVYITANLEECRQLANAGADIIALDATGRTRQDGLSVKQTIDVIHNEIGKPVWADIADLQQGINAAADGADLISTTLYGYTRETQLPHGEGPSFDLLESLAKNSSVPVVLEGRVWFPDEVTKAFALGSFAVVVGSAITRPALITERFVRAIP